MEREEAERERDHLRQELREELHVLGREQEAREAAEGQQGRAEPRSATGGTQEGVQRPWWRRMLGR